MDEVLTLLKNYKLEKFYDQFVELGIEDVQDFIDGVTDEDLDNMGKIYEQIYLHFYVFLLIKLLHAVNYLIIKLHSLCGVSQEFTQVQKNKFRNMIEEIQRRGSAPPHEEPLRKSLQAYSLYYSFPKCQGLKEILGKSLKLERQ